MKIMKRYGLKTGIVGLVCLIGACSYEQPVFNPIQKEHPGNGGEEVTPPMPERPDEDINLDEWNLVWNDEFEGNNQQDLDDKWIFENVSYGHILCSRWRENAIKKDGTLRLLVKKNGSDYWDRDPYKRDWTAASMSTKEKFKYGYYECRYRYSAAMGTNNSFWIMSDGSKQPEKGHNYEIDINEGHYPNEINTNIHKYEWKGEHTADQQGIVFGTEPGYSFQLENPVKTTKIRFSSNHYTYFHIREFRILGVAGSYPDPLSNEWETVKGITNYATDADITASGCYNVENNPVRNVCDGKSSTSWIAQAEGEKWLEFKFSGDKTIGCIQFVNGWQKDGKWQDLIGDYKIQYEKDGKWVDIAAKDIIQEMNFGKDYHTYGLEWTEDELIYYFDRKEIRREKNMFCFIPAPVYLSLAIIGYGAGPVTDAIDGTQMEVDYVRIYKRKE